jgi:preprotein translocase subunit SecB
MADANKPNGGAKPADDNATRTGGEPQLRVLAQYIKDMSFENPNAPASLQPPSKQPDLKVEIAVGVRPVADDVFESVINFEGRASIDDTTLYQIELSYAGLFELQNMPEQARQPVLLVNCPTLLFPYLRRIIADITRDGGFPPLMLDPIDFGGLYQQNVVRSGSGKARPLA